MNSSKTTRKMREAMPTQNSDARNQTTTTLDLSPARQSLRQAIEAQARARVLVDKAQAVVDAANAAVEAARAEAVKHDEIGADAIQARLAALKGDPSAKSPAQLREASRNRLIAKEELMAADETLRAAQKELAEYHDNIVRGQKVSNGHATSVLSESVTDVIA
jgi:hypothetical protein